MYKEEAPETFEEVSGGSETGNAHGYTYSNTHPEPVKTQIKAEGKIIGYLEDHSFIKPVLGSKHRLKRPPAWAIDAEAFDRKVKPNATKIVVRDRETGLEYHCLVEVFDRLKAELDRGFGRQYFLTLNHWEVKGNGHHQLGLWGGGDDGR